MTRADLIAMEYAAERSHDWQPMGAALRDMTRDELARAWIDLTDAADRDQRIDWQSMTDRGILAELARRWLLEGA